MGFVTEFSKLLGVGGTLGFLLTVVVLVAAMIAYPRSAVFVCLPLAIVLTVLMWPIGRRARILAYGTPAAAKIIDAQFTNIAIKIGGSRTQTRLRLTVEFPRPNLPPVRTEIVTYVLQYNLPDLTPGKSVNLKYDPQNPTRAAIIEEDTRARF